ncbi:hypothetical protein, conserved [Eimeria tenella]|uniref:mRNA 5'-phosphatase n=1 Tax=Eimeria tenella TaxID=5802 RepID=U6KHZ4_EIMTE|nr:hypothetical protein, conserved [Eimeria tenella]CDJ37564.1 hypothetical protein, conserved [Eimeria tenella]|eukprot:XP_013228402.1 hypothetical protein, conserved [Eimeria tenella]
MCSSRKGREERGTTRRWRGSVSLVLDGERLSRNISPVPNTQIISATATIGILKTCKVAFTKGSGLRVDLTKVQQQTKPSWGAPPEARREALGRWTHEVELELHPMQIARAVLHLQQTGDPRPLWCLCCTFLSLLRELAAALNSPLGPRGPRGPRGAPGGGPLGAPGAQGPWDDLEEVQMAAAEEVAFKHYLSEQLPLIGDYAYRAVVQQMLQQQRSSSAAAAPSLQDFLKQPEAESRCLYTQNKTHISGPWIPHKDADGRVHLIELKR